MQLSDLTALGLDEAHAKDVLELCLRELDEAQSGGPTLESGLRHGDTPAEREAPSLRAALEAHYA